MPFPLPSRELNADQRAERARGATLVFAGLGAASAAVLGLIAKALGLL